MNSLIVILQIAIAMTILNVWLFRFNRPTPWRGGNATDMKQEFGVYGLPGWCVTVIGIFKITCAALLIAGVWIPEVTRFAAAGLGVLMLSAVAMHVKVKDPLRKSMPAVVLFILCLVVGSAVHR